MSQVAIQQQQQNTVGGTHYVFTSFIYNATGDTCLVPTGCIAASALVHDSAFTPPTSVTIAQGATADTLTITGGTVGKGLTIVTRHTGGPANGR